MNLVAGIHPVEILLRAFPSRVKTLYILMGKRRSRRILSLLERAATLRIPVVEVPPDEAPSLGIPHQGIWAKISDFAYTPFGEWLNGQEAHDTSTLLVLDGVTDPHNLGAILRSAVCLGCDGVLLPKDRSARVTPTVWKASAGAVGFLPVIRETNLARCLRRLKEKDFWVFGTRAGEGIPLYEAPWTGKSVIVLGSEEKGMRPLLASHCDMHLSIPLLGPISSLNVSVAAGIVLYERARGRETSSKEGV